MEVFGVPPPPKFHDHASGSPVVRSVKVTAPPITTVVIFEVKSATGGAVGSQPSELSKLLLTPLKMAFISAACSLLNMFLQFA